MSLSDAIQNEMRRIQNVLYHPYAMEEMLVKNLETIHDQKNALDAEQKFLEEEIRAVKKQQEPWEHALKLRSQQLDRVLNNPVTCSRDYMPILPLQSILITELWKEEHKFKYEDMQYGLDNGLNSFMTSTSQQTD